MEPWMFAELGWLLINLGHFNHIRWWERETALSQQLRNNPDPVKTADESQGTKSGNTASPSQKEAEKEKNKNV